MQNNRHRGNDWDSTEGRKEGEGRAPLTRDETLTKVTGRKCGDLAGAGCAQSGARDQGGSEAANAYSRQQGQGDQSGGGGEGGLHRLQHSSPRGLR